MTTTKTRTTTKRRSPAVSAVDEGRRSRLSSAAHRVAGAVKTAGSTAVTLIRHVPGTVRATRDGAKDATSALQTLPDSTLRWVAATSVGLSTGLRIARAPRIVVAAGALPALIAGAAIALRPVEPPIPADPVATPTGDPPA